MKAIYFNGVEPIYKDVPIPKIAENESLVKILMAGVCNTDKEILKGYKQNFKQIMGHEFVGIVEKSNNKDLIGKRVVGELNEGCKNCEYCKQNLQKHCVNRKVIGIHNKDGCFSEYISINTELLHIVPTNVTTNNAIFTEPLAAAIEILEQVKISPSSKVAIIGDGRLSYMIASVLHLLGTSLTIIGKHNEKLELFKKFGQITQKTSNTFDVVIEACGSESGFFLAQRLVKNRGIIVLKSTYAGNLTINMSNIVVNEITVVGSRCGPFEPALNLMSKNLVTFSTPTYFKLYDFKKAFATNCFKAVFDFT